MRATSSPSTLTAASLTRCTRARIAPYSARMAATDVVDAYLASEPELGARRLAHGEWGISVPAETLGGHPLDVGLRIADGLLRAQALALPGAGELVDPWMLLWWNRQTRHGALRLHARARHLGARRPAGGGGRRARTWTGCSGCWSRRRWRCASTPRGVAGEASG